MDLPIAPVSEADIAALTLDAVREGRGGWICPINLDVLRRVVRDPDQRALVEQADLLTADGMPLVWASRVQRTPVPERVSGSSLIRTIPAAGRATGASVFLLGGDRGVAEAAAQSLRDSVPGVRIAGTHCPPVGFEDSP